MKQTFKQGAAVLATGWNFVKDKATVAVAVATFKDDLHKSIFKGNRTVHLLNSNTHLLRRCYEFSSCSIKPR